MSERVMFVAYERWETTIASRFLEKWQHDASKASQPSLLIADPFQLRTRGGESFLSELKSKTLFDTNVVFEPLLEWQQKIGAASNSEAKSSIQRIERKAGLENLADLVTSDLHIVPRERSPFYRPMSKAQGLMAAALVYERTLDLFDRVNPTLIVMLDEQYLVKNFVARLASARRIPIRVFRMARFRRFVKCDDFFLPSREQSERKDTSAHLRSGKSHRFGQSLYERNQSVQQKGWIQELRQEKIHSSMNVIRQAVRDQKRRKKRGWASRPKEYRRELFWVSSEPRVRFYLVMRSLRTLRYIWLSFPFVGRTKVKSPYILIPLHVRPETSTLTQGPGMEDEQVVKRVADIIRQNRLDLNCVVLEHPSMVEYRRMKFYRKLANLPSVVLADPGLPTSELLRDASGIVTISGTAALEGSLLDVPVHVVGFPEFLHSIASSGWEALPTFLEQVANQQGPQSRQSVADYLSNLEEEGVEIPWSWETISSSEKVEETVNGLLQLFRRSLEKSAGETARPGGPQ